MSNKVLNTLILAFFVATISCNMAMNKLDSLKANNFQQNSIGVSLVESIQLQMQSGGSLDEITRLLNGLITDLGTQQDRDDNDHTNKNTEWNKQIKAYQVTIKQLAKKIATLNSQIRTSEGKIKATKRSIKINQAQITLVQGKTASLDEARQADIAATKKRSARQAEMLKAVKYLVVELNKALDTSNFIQYDNVKQVLGTLVKENPIEALVQLTMTFNPESVRFAIKKLSAISSSLQESLEDESLQTAQAILNYNSLRNELKSFEKNAQKILGENQGVLATEQQNLAALKQDLSETKAAKKTTEKLKSDLEAKQIAYNIAYKARQVQRVAEEKTINQVITILEDHSDATDKAVANADASASNSTSF